MQKLPVVFSVATMVDERRPSQLDQLAPAAAPWWIRRRPCSSLLAQIFPSLSLPLSSLSISPEARNPSSQSTTHRRHPGSSREHLSSPEDPPHRLLPRCQRNRRRKARIDRPLLFFPDTGGPLSRHCRRLRASPSLPSKRAHSG